jgi:lipopolysaccharide transport system permease protein
MRARAADSLDATRTGGAPPSRAGSAQETTRDLPVVRIEPVKSRLRLRDIRHQAPVIRVLAARDLKARFKQSLLGPLWIVFQPLALLVAFAVGFKSVSSVNTGGIPYAVFALAGVSLWSYFQAAMTAGTPSIIGNGALVMKTACPRFAFPIASLVSCVPSFLIPFAASLIAAIVDGRASARLILIPLIAVWVFILAAGIIALSSAVAVRFRDVIQALPFILQLGAFLVPVGYPVSTLGQPLRFLISLNPLTGVMEAWRWAMLDAPHVYVPSVYLSLVGGAVLAVLGWRVFGRMEVKMADVI